MNKVIDDPNHWDTYAEYVAENADYRKELERQVDYACECEIADAKADRKRKKDGEAMLAEEEYYPIDFDDMEVI